LYFNEPFNGRILEKALTEPADSDRLYITEYDLTLNGEVEARYLTVFSRA
jgi:hypothetical protein